MNIPKLFFFATLIGIAPIGVVFSQSQSAGVTYVKINPNQKLEFFNYIVDHKLSSILGSFINDSTKITISTFLMNAPACNQRVLNELINNEKLSLSDTLLQTKHLVKGLFLTDSEMPYLFEDGTFTHVILYSDNSPKKFKKDFNRLLEIKQKGLLKGNLLIVNLNS